MNFNKFSKAISTIVSLCCLYAGEINALKDIIINARKSDETKLQMPDVGYPISEGLCGYIYEHPEKEKSETRLIKKVKNGKYPEFGKLHEFDIAHLMMQQDVPSSLMKVYFASNYNWPDDTWYEIEKIKGVSIYEIKQDIDWDFFCRYWVIDLFEGMKYFQDQVGITELLDGKGEKVECFALLGDRGGNNMLVRTDGPNKNKPVLIDYSFATYYRTDGERLYTTSQFNELRPVAIDLLYVLDRYVINAPNLEKQNNLKNYLEKIKEMEELPNENTLNEIIKKVKEITGVS